MTEIQVFENSKQFNEIANKIKSLKLRGKKIDKIFEGIILILSTSQNSTSENKCDVVRNIIQNVLKLLIDNGCNLTIWRESEDQIILKTTYARVGFTLKLERTMANLENFWGFHEYRYCGHNKKNIVLLTSGLQVAEHEYLRHWIIGDGLFAIEMVCPALHSGYYLSVEIREIFLCDAKPENPFHEKIKSRMLSEQMISITKTFCSSKTFAHQSAPLIYIPVALTQLPEYRGVDDPNILESWRVIQMWYSCRVQLTRTVTVDREGKSSTGKIEKTITTYFERYVKKLDKRCRKVWSSIKADVNY